MVEIISPPWFGRDFVKSAQVLAADGPPDMDVLTRLAASFDLTMPMERVPELMTRSGVSFESCPFPAFGERSRGKLQQRRGGRSSVAVRDDGDPLFSPYESTAGLHFGQEPRPSLGVLPWRPIGDGRRSL